MDDYNTLLESAKAETGLTDYGDDAFKEGLELLVKSLREEANLNEQGQHALQDRLLGHLKQRLKIEDWYRRHPEIDDVEITAPLFGISLPRTGSSDLSFLLASDPNIRYLRVWESSQPCPPPSTVEGPDPRRGQTSEADRAVGQKSHTPSGIDGAMECLDLMALDFKSQIFQALAKIPSYVDWLEDADLESTYLYEKRVLKLLQWGEQPKPWRLKTPAHMLFMDDLDKTFPDARFVMTHRDPTEVINSVATVYADVISHFTDEIDYHYIGEINLRTWTKAIKRAMAFRNNGNDHRFYDIHFKAMHKDPLGEVKGLYQWLGEPVTPEFEANMARWWKENSENRAPSKHLDPALFGINLDEVKPLFSDYINHMEKWTSQSSS